VGAVTTSLRGARSTFLTSCRRTHKNNRRIILEAKGRFGDKFGNGAKERQKLILLQEQHPELDIRIVFQRASTAIYKGSKTTYAKWADDHGFKWSDKGTVPARMDQGDANVNYEFTAFRSLRKSPMNSPCWRRSSRRSRTLRTAHRLAFSVTPLTSST
jgi:hypothetical protein